MSSKYTYHFSLHFNFKKDTDVKKLEKMFKIKAFKLTPLKESKGDDEHKRAKLWYKSADFNEINVDEQIEKFTSKIFENFNGVKDLLEEFDGRAIFSLVFTSASERPIIALTSKTIEMFGKLGFSFEVDFV